MRWNKVGLILIAITITGCASSQTALDAHSPQFGEAIAHNITAQRVAPTAEEKANTFIPPNRARQKAAKDAYESGTVTQPSLVNTTEQ
jgi:hypothetical protein